MPPLQKLTRLVKGAELRETLILQEAGLKAIGYRLWKGLVPTSSSVKRCLSGQSTLGTYIELMADGFELLTETTYRQKFLAFLIFQI